MLHKVSAAAQIGSFNKELPFLWISICILFCVWLPSISEILVYYFSGIKPVSDIGPFINDTKVSVEGVKTSDWSIPTLKAEKKHLGKVKSMETAY